MDDGVIMGWFVLVMMTVGMVVVAYFIGKHNQKREQKVERELLETQITLDDAEAAIKRQATVAARFQEYQNMGDEAFIEQVNKDLAALREENK